MPSPIGHALTGVAIGHLCGRQALSRRDAWWLTLCGVVAIAPDLDILWGHHRTWTHSLGATLAACVIAAVVASLRRLPVGATALAIGLAFGSHVFLDWLGRDSRDPRGVMAFWPISSAYYVSDLDVFTEISRRYWLPEQFIVGNLKSIAREIILLAPVVWLAWRFRRPHS